MSDRPVGFVYSNGCGEIKFIQAGHPGNYRFYNGQLSQADGGFWTRTYPVYIGDWDEKGNPHE